MKEKITHIPAIEEEHLKQLTQSQGFFFAFFPSLALKNCLIPYCSSVSLPPRYRKAA